MRIDKVVKSQKHFSGNPQTGLIKTRFFSVSTLLINTRKITRSEKTENVKVVDFHKFVKILILKK